MPNQYTQIILLCEDLQQAVFARTFLIEYYGIHYRRIRIDFSSAGKGAAEQFVREHLPAEVAKYRNRKDIRIALVVITDADTLEPLERRTTLTQKFKEQGIDTPQASERIAIFIPKRNIETWIYFLLGKAVDEDKDYPHLQERESDCNKAVRKLAQNCRKNFQLDPNAPPSLKEACEELKRIPRFDD